jgi:hypothetical protein
MSERGRFAQRLVAALRVEDARCELLVECEIADGAHERIAASIALVIQ